MNNLVIREMLLGNKGSMQALKATPEMIELMDKVTESCIQLQENLPAEVKVFHDNYANALEESSYEETVFFYIQGFKLGVKIGQELAN